MHDTFSNCILKLINKHTEILSYRIALIFGTVVLLTYAFLISFGHNTILILINKLMKCIYKKHFERTKCRNSKGLQNITRVSTQDEDHLHMICVILSAVT